MIRISPLVWSIGERGFIMDGLAIFVVLCCIGMVCTGINEAVEWYKRRRKRCPHGTLVKVIGGCANCEAEQRRPQERQALSAQRERASRELRGSEIRRLSEAWVSNAGAYLEMSPQQFETAIANLFRRLGYDVEQTPISCDGGKDAILRAADGKYLLECKCYGPAQSVGRRDLQILFAAMHAEQAVGGFCVTTGRFTRTAKDYAKSVNIALYDRARLPFLVNEAHPVSTDFSTASVVCRECGSVVSVPVKVVPASAQCENGHTITSNIVTADFRILAEGEVPYCDSCGAPMRLVNWNGREFWGCTGYPKCRATKPLRGYRHSTTRV